MADIPLHIQKRATEIYSTSGCSLKEAYDKAFMENQMSEEGFSQIIEKLFFGGKK